MTIAAERGTNEGNNHASNSDSEIGSLCGNRPVRPPPSSKYERLIARAKQVPPATTIVVHPCDETSLRGAVEAAEAGIIMPILVGPAAKIPAWRASTASISAIRDRRCAAHSDAAAAKGVELIREGKGELLDERQPAHRRADARGGVGQTGLRTARRISHVFIMDVPTYAETLFITDAAINIFPDLDAKRDIVQNAIDLFTQVGLGTPRVAILSAVETVTTKIPSTIDAAALCKMAERGQITGGCSTDRSPSTMRSTRRRHGSRASSPRLPAGRRSWSCPISRPATCWPRT